MTDPTPFPQPGDERQLVFTASQAARYLSVSLATIRRWSDAGHLECYRTPGGQRRFSRDQLDAFIMSLSPHAGETAAGEGDEDEQRAETGDAGQGPG